MRQAKAGLDGSRPVASRAQGRLRDGGKLVPGLRRIIYTFRMWRGLRLAFVCLLAVALPLQGVTAATMTACGMAQHRTPSTEASEHAHHMGSDGTEGHLHLAGETHDHASDMHASGDATGEKPANSQKCSVCASCCVGAAVPAEPLSFAPVKLTDQFAPLVPRSVAAFVTEGLERPPRLLLA